jgi:AraC family transcriptional regulator of adaptative response / DNA-3-methyladenine glycosylase II
VADADLGGLGLTGGRIRALHALAAAVADGTLRLDRGADPVATTRGLVGLPGIGPWTAGYVAMRALGDRDALPAADLGLRRALERLGHAGDPRALSIRAEAWRPWRAYGCQHLWTSLLPAPGTVSP